MIIQSGESLDRNASPPDSFRLLERVEPGEHGGTSVLRNSASKHKFVNVGGVHDQGFVGNQFGFE